MGGRIARPAKNKSQSRSCQSGVARSSAIDDCDECITPAKGKRLEYRLRLGLHFKSKLLSRLVAIQNGPDLYTQRLQRKWLLQKGSGGKKTVLVYSIIGMPGNHKHAGLRAGFFHLLHQHAPAAAGHYDVSYQERDSIFKVARDFQGFICRASFQYLVATFLQVFRRGIAELFLI